MSVILTPYFLLQRTNVEVVCGLCYHMVPIQQMVPITGTELRVCTDSRPFYAQTLLALKYVHSFPLYLVLVKSQRGPGRGPGGTLRDHNTLDDLHATFWVASHCEVTCDF